MIERRTARCHGPRFPSVSWRRQPARIVLAAFAAFWACLSSGCRQSVVPKESTIASAVASPGGLRFERSKGLESAAVVYDNGEDFGHNAILESLGGGVGMVDYDLDGRLDLCFPGGGRFLDRQVQGRPTRLLRQRDVEVFEDVAAAACIDRPQHYSHGCSVADFNNDGFPDMLITGYGGLTLWANLGEGTFQDVTDSAQLHDAQWSSSAAWGDVNGDGILDVYVAHYVNWSFDNNPPCAGPTGETDVCPPRQFDGLDDVLYLGRGDGTFSDGTRDAALVPAGKGLGVVMVDLDDDRDLDIYVANDTVPNFLYINDGHGRFEDRGMISGVALDDRATPNGSMGVAVLDFDEDGLLDLWVTNYEDELFALYRNLGTGNFQYVSRRAGLNRLGTLFVGFGCAAADLDADGDEDVAVANGHVVHHPRNAPVKQPRLVMLNVGNGQFERLTFKDSDTAFSRPALGRGLACGDVDGDGRTDLAFVNTNEPADLFYSRTATGGESQPRSLRLRLIGTDSTRDVIGACAVLETSRGKFLRTLIGGGSYLSTSELVLTWYWPGDVEPRQLTVTWPSGRTTTVPLADADAASADPQLRWIMIEPSSDAVETRWFVETRVR
jgi:hypothetical protein